jgi:plasmid stabilization system protein ParE
MKVVYTAAALRDLDEIAEWLAVHYPTIRTHD